MLQTTAGKSPQIDQERLQSALDAAGVGVWDYDVVKDELVWSPHCYRLFGITHPFPITYNTFLEGVHPDDRARTEQVVQQAFRPELGGSYDIEYRTVGYQDGLVRWVRATGKAYFQSNGKPYRFIGTLTDITPKKEAELRLKESEERFRNMADSAPVMIWITDPNGDCTYLNNRWLEFTGQSMADGKGLGWITALHPEDQDMAKAAFIDGNRKHTAFRVEYRLRNTTGAYRWMLDTASPRFDDRGNYMGYIGSVVDISERREFEEALRFRSAQLEAQNEASVDGLLLVDAKGKIISYNRHFATIWNMPQSIIDEQNDTAALEHAMTQLVDPQGFIDRVNYCYTHINEPAYDEITFNNGQILERTGRAVIGADGTYYGWMWQFRDVTQRRAEQRELELRTAVLEAQNEGSPHGVLVINEHRQISYFNKRYAEMFDLPPELAQAPSREELMAHFKQTILNFDLFQARVAYLYSNAVDESVDELQLANGKIIERTGYRIKSTEGRYFGWTWQFRDITTERRAVEELQVKNRQLENVIGEFKFVTDFMPQMVWATRPDGYHDFFNKQWYDYTGLSYEQTKNQGWSLVLHPNDYECTWRVWQHALETGTVYETAYRMRRHDGVYRWFLARAIPMQDANGTILKWFGTCTDIDDQQRAAALLEQKVEERTQELKETNKMLERSNAELEQFAYVASHDLQEPLRKIRTFTSMLENEIAGGALERSKFYAERIWQSSSRMQELIRDLLDFSRLNRGSSKDDFGPTDLNQIAKQVLEDLELGIAQKQAQIRIEPLPVIEANALQMSQLFYNLLNNAVKFVRAGVTPEVVVRHEIASAEIVAEHKLQAAAGPYHLFSVQDNGIGFHNDYAQQIFTIFQRLHNKTAFEGTGIGLALCQKVVANHKGAIWAEGEEGKGATFHILLPEKQAH